jgi:phenylalanyl-tRNA synthetase beta chain
VLLECAFFSPLSITGRARRHGLHTDASHRYERGVDPALQYKALERATRLLIDLCGGEAGPVIDVTNEETLPKRATITLRRSKLDRLIGHHIDDAQVTDILQRLGCEVTVGRTNGRRLRRAGVSTWRSKKIWSKKWLAFMATTTFLMSRCRRV